MTPFPRWSAILLSVLACAPAADEAASGAAAAAHRAEVEAWRAERVERLRRPDGWLALAGLFWLEEGSSAAGSDPAAELVFPPSAPPRLGIFTRSGRRVEFEPAAGVQVLADGEPVGRVELVSDVEGEPTVLEHGTLSFYVLERGDRVGVRLKDSASELLASFEGIDSFPVDPAWRLTARFEPFDEPRTIQVPNIIGGTLPEPSYGRVVFEVAGKRHVLEPFGEPDGELFLVFGDETNAHETYGGGRFLYAGPPAADGSLVVDFNKAYNPPCVFTPYATCPLPTPENRLPFRVEAGEKSFGAAH